MSSHVMAGALHRDDEAQDLAQSFHSFLNLCLHQHFFIHRSPITDEDGGGTDETLDVKTVRHVPTIRYFGLHGLNNRI